MKDTQSRLNEIESSIELILQCRAEDTGKFKTVTETLDGVTKDIAALKEDIATKKAIDDLDSHVDENLKALYREIMIAFTVIAIILAAVYILINRSIDSKIESLSEKQTQLEMQLTETLKALKTPPTARAPQPAPPAKRRK